MISFYKVIAMEETVILYKVDNLNDIADADLISQNSQ